MLRTFFHSELPLPLNLHMHLPQDWRNFSSDCGSLISALTVVPSNLLPSFSFGLTLLEGMS